MKVADIRLFWTKSPSADVDHVEVTVTQNGTQTVNQFGPEVEEFQIVAQASSSVQFQVDTFDTEGNKATSVVYGFTLGDLESPLPATNLGHEILGVRDVPDVPPNPPVSKPR